MNKKKLLIIGDSNSLPRYNTSEEDKIKLDDIYINLLKKKFEKIEIEKFAVGGITTGQLFNFSIPYYTEWKPDFVIIQSGINDAKNQFLSSQKANYLYKFLSIFGFGKSFIKDKIIYNNNLIKIKSVSKVSRQNFEKQIKKIKSLFVDAQIFWIEIYSDEKIELERQNTLDTIKEFNSMLKDLFSSNFIELGEIKDRRNFTTDGYHLNKNGQLLLAEKISKILIDQSLQQ